MPLSNPNIVRLQVTIHKAKGAPARTVLSDVRSIMEIADEENESLKSVSFYDAKGSEGGVHWHDFEIEHGDRIIIERRK